MSFGTHSYQRHSTQPLTAGQLKMVALGIEPAMIDEDTAAAVCGLPLKRFRAECPIAGQRVGNRVLRPLDLVKKWSVRQWAEAIGHSLEGLGSHADAAEEDWESCLPDGPKAKGGCHGVAH